MVRFSDSSLDQIANLERMNYVVSRPVVEATPGIELLIEDDIILMRNQIVPDADSTHACLLQANPQAVDELISRTIEYFRAKALPATIFVSPACRPQDLEQRLLERGFSKHSKPESWLTFGLNRFNVPPAVPNLTVRQVRDEANCRIFVQVWGLIFGVPAEFRPAMMQLLTPSLRLPGVYHNIAYVGEQPVAVCSLVCHQKFAILGGFGVLPEYRGRRVATGLAVATVRQARRCGVETVIVQTTAGARFERLLIISGFKKVFSRTGYTLG